MSGVGSQGLGYQDLGFALGLRPSKKRDLGLRIEETRGRNPKWRSFETVAY